MASHARTQSVDKDKERDDGLSKVMRRMKTVLRGARSNRNSVSSIPPVAPARPVQPVNPTITMQEERARALFAKYGLTLEPGEWITGPNTLDRPVERVQKPIRMRIHRHCHRCMTSFGADRTCVTCQHERCKKCYRYPPLKHGHKDDAKTKPKKKAPATAAAPAPPVTASTSRAQGVKIGSTTIVLTFPSRTGGQDLVLKQPRQRIRRNCHVCSTLFIGLATECEKCSHIRCKKCPRDPPKLKKYPNGYPGDADPPFEPQERIFRKPRRRIRWSCHECSAPFCSPENTCRGCKHERCKDCIRDPPKKIKPAPDPDILKRVEERLAALNISLSTDK